MKEVTDNSPAAQARLISKPALLERVPLSYPTIWKKMRDGTFPRAVQVGEKTMWHSHEIEAWLAALPRRSFKGDPGHEPTMPAPHTARRGKA